MDKKIVCPCCGEIAFKEEGEYEICSVCDWEDDPLQRDDPNDDLGANILSLNAYKAAWKKKQAA